ncbi:MAG: DNA-processing protein DprA [Spirochaetaceae bacterium]|nr:DNA-processing protein DprA [Spirochaetaceae bacterium]
MENKKLLLQLGIARLGFLSTKDKLKLENNLDNISNLAILSIDDISLIVGRVVNTREWPIENFEKIILKDFSVMQAFSIDFVHCKDKNYPVMLNQVYDAPYGLFVRGNLSVLNTPAVSIVGTRNPSVSGFKTTFNFSKELTTLGYTVVSGLALGIDTAAHKGTILSGKTIAVLACGLDNIYPTANKKLAVEIIKNGGCLISEYSPGEPPLKWRFIQRNRIISGLSEATVVMESPPKSGALITADFALEQNRDLYFHESALSVQERYNIIAQKKGLSEKVQKLRCVQRYIDEGAPCISSVKDLVTSLFIK